MEGSGESRGARDALGDRGTWFAQQLGEGWTEVEPGIYRFNAGVKNEAGIRITPASEPDLLEALDPGDVEPAPPESTRRLFGRRARSLE